MDSVFKAQAAQWLAQGVPAVVVEVTATQGSVPREAGTHMLVRGPSGAAAQVLGTVGGGHLELKAIEAAHALLAGVQPAPLELNFALGPALGQCCGGRVQLRLALLSAQSLAAWADPVPRFQLQLYGAGHVGRAIAKLLADLPCQVQWIDEREAEFPAALALPAHIQKVCVEPVEAEVAVAAPNSHFLVLTHSHDLDMAISEAILRRGDFAFFGLIGSQTKRARFTRRFEDRGIAKALIERMQCPIGVSGIDGKEPAVIALGVVAQLLQHSNGGA